MHRAGFMTRFYNPLGFQDGGSPSVGVALNIRGQLGLIR